MDNHREAIWGIRPEDRQWFQLLTLIGGTAGSIILTLLELDSLSGGAPTSEVARNIVLGIGGSFIASGFIAWGLLQAKELIMSLGDWIREATERRRKRWREEVLEEGREEGRAEGVEEGRAEGRAEGIEEGIRLGYARALENSQEGKPPQPPEPPDTDATGPMARMVTMTVSIGQGKKADLKGLRKDARKGELKDGLRD